MNSLSRNLKHTRNGGILAISLLLTAACGRDRMTNVIDQTAADMVGV